MELAESSIYKDALFYNVIMPKYSPGQWSDQPIISLFACLNKEHELWYKITTNIEGYNEILNTDENRKLLNQHCVFGKRI